MHIGVVPYLDHEGGGVRQYSLTVLRALRIFAESRPAIKVTVFQEEGMPTDSAVQATWDALPLLPPSARRSPLHHVRPVLSAALQPIRRVIGEGPHREAWRGARRGIERWLHRQNRQNGSLRPDQVRARPDVSRWYRAKSIELMLYPVASPLAFETDIPYVMAIHDLQHRLQPHFTEVSADDQWVWREYLYRNGVRYATIVLADSEVGREDILQCYGAQWVTPDRVKVLPYLPPPYLSESDLEFRRARAQALYRLPDRYLFYPAHFWPSKNHIGLALALGRLRDLCGLRIPLVLCGSRNGALREQTFRSMMSAAEAVGVASQIAYVGYVPDELMAGMFAGAAAMVMPTFFGPTNLPIVEAWSFGCPVLSSRVHGIVEQVGDAGLLVDPASTEEIADGLRRLWTDDRLRAGLARRGRERADAYTESDFQERFFVIMEEAIARVERAEGGRP